MFTGIVQAVGVVQAIRRESPGVRLTLDCPNLPRPIDPGASVCVSGVCLTVTAADARLLSFDVVPETLSRTRLGSLSGGHRLNLERSLRAGDAMDGHVVQGHVDGTATVERIESGETGHVVTFAAGPELMPYIIPKGSIAIDGVSLTIASVEADRFTVALIPTTLALTTLGSIREDERVNIETDILARTLVATLERWRAAQFEAEPRTAIGRREDCKSGSVESLRDNGWT